MKTRSLFLSTLICALQICVLHTSLLAQNATQEAKEVKQPVEQKTGKQTEQQLKRQTEQAARLKELEDQGFTPLFNGEDLTGWTNPYKHGEAKVVDGEIHLVSGRKFFLTTEKTYKDFELTAEIKLPSGKSNSGIMFRCHVAPNRVFGYQAECDGSKRCWSGGLYDEGRRAWIWPCKTGEKQKASQEFFAKDEVKGALIRDDWNRYTIRCEGDSIVIAVNGVETTNLKDDVDASGHIGIQHHGEKGQIYQFRNIFIREIDSKEKEIKEESKEIDKPKSEGSAKSDAETTSPSNDKN